MTDDKPARPARKGPRLVAVAVVGLIVGSLVTVVVLQQMQIADLRDEPKSTSGQRCDEARKVVDRAMHPIPQSTREPDPHTAANAVQQNPDCFNAAARAEAQTWLDQARSE